MEEVVRVWKVGKKVWKSKKLEVERSRRRKRGKRGKRGKWKQ